VCTLCHLVCTCVRVMFVNLFCACLVRGNMAPRAPRPPRGPREHFFACVKLKLKFYFLCGVLCTLTVEINIRGCCVDTSCCW